MTFLIVGGGCFGLSTASALCEAGIEPKSIFIFDKSERLPAENSASYDINKMVRSDYGDDPLYTEMAINAMQIFRQWNQEYSAGDAQEKKLFHESEKKLFHECGVLIATSNISPDCFEAKSSNLQDSIQDIFPSSKVPAALRDLHLAFPLGYFNRKGGWCDSALTMTFLVDKLAAIGVNFRLGPKDGNVVFLDSSQDGMGKIRVEDGAEYTGTVILTAGAWTSKLIPIVSDFMSATAQCVIHMRLTDQELLRKYGNSCCWMADISRTGFYGFPLQPRTGILKFANHGKGFPSPKSCKSRLEDEEDEYLFLSQKWHSESLVKFRAFLSLAFPDICEHAVDYFRVCWYMDTLSGDFLIDFVPTFSPGSVIVASGGSGHGFKFLPVIGKCVVDLLAGKPVEPRFSWKHHAGASTINKNSHK